jgi:hypothetical protein
LRQHILEETAPLTVGIRGTKERSLKQIASEAVSVSQNAAGQDFKKTKEIPCEFATLPWLMRYSFDGILNFKYHCGKQVLRLFLGSAAAAFGMVKHGSGILEI